MNLHPVRSPNGIRAKRSIGLPFLLLGRLQSAGNNAVTPAAILITSGLAASLGWRITDDRRVLPLLVLGAMGLCVAAVPWLWMPAVSLLGLVALNDEGITPPKLLFIGILLGLSAIAVVSGSAATRRSTTLIAPLLRVSIAASVLLPVSLLVALLHGTHATTWARNSTALLMLVLMPFVAYFAWQRESRLGLERAFVVATSVGAIVYVLTWAENRDFIATPVDSFLFAPGSALLALYYYAIAKVTLHQRAMRWSIILIALLMGLLLTGSRNLLVHIIGFVTIPLVARASGDKRKPVPVGRLVLTLLALLGVIASARLLDVFDLGSIVDRYSTISSLLSSDSVDSSRLTRTRFTVVAWEIFKDNPILGSGPGFDISSYWEAAGFPDVYVGPGFGPPRVLNDTPLATLSAYGLVGIGLELALGWTYWKFAAGARKSTEEFNAPSLALQGWMITMLITLFYQNPLDDKSLLFGGLFLLALSLPATGSRGSQISPPLQTTTYPGFTKGKTIES